jgi:3-phosphoshikimate 1-carboxyvinyltransferase
MRATVEPGGTVSGTAVVPGDKSIAHRWLMLAATGAGASRVTGLPASLDVAATARCLGQLLPQARPALEVAFAAVPSQGQGHGFTWDDTGGRNQDRSVEVEGKGRSAMVEPAAALDCANSGTTLRLLAGMVAAAPFRCVLVGDESLRNRPMERVAEPLRAMGAEITSTDRHAPLEVRGGRLRGIRYEAAVPSAQVKSAVLLAGLAASGTTEVVETVQTRDHTERALLALGAPLVREGEGVQVRRYQHPGFEAKVPGDISSAAFLVAAAGLTGAQLQIEDVGLNPTRTRFLEVVRRMGVQVETVVVEERLGEPVGEVRVRAGRGLRGTEVHEDELPLVIDEVPVLAALAANAAGESWFAGAGELRVKESDRLRGIADGIASLGGHAAVEGDDLVLAGGGLAGGRAEAFGDHRLAMALAVAALGARGTSVVDGIESADVSFPGFVSALGSLGARIGAGP